jgi:hypothetical protein
MMPGWVAAPEVEAGAWGDPKTGGAPVAGRNRPSFLKKQKEEQRRARAARKREERRARKKPTPADVANGDVSEEARATTDRGERGKSGG